MLMTTTELPHNAALQLYTLDTLSKIFTVIIRLNSMSTKPLINSHNATHMVTYKSSNSNSNPNPT